MNKYIYTIYVHRQKIYNLFGGCHGRLWWYGGWIYYYLCNQCLSALKLWIRIPLRGGVLDTTLCDKVWQWLATGRWFSPGTPVFSTNKTYCHDITEILLKVALNTINQTKTKDIQKYKVIYMYILWNKKPLVNQIV